MGSAKDFLGTSIFFKESGKVDTNFLKFSAEVPFSTRSLMKETAKAENDSRSSDAA